MSLGESTRSAVSPESPWLGLRPFTEDVREYFFGRNAEVSDLFQRVVHRPLTVLFGRSGLGKTSLLQAALMPRLRMPASCPCFSGWITPTAALRLSGNSSTQLPLRSQPPLRALVRRRAPACQRRAAVAHFP